jgi:CDP-glucose 4,6-dehydratase
MKPSSTILNKNTVLVTGATGVVGSNLVRRLLDLGASVVCFIRDHDPASALWFSGDIDRVSVCTGRLEVFEHVKCALVEREIDTVFHLGAQAIVGAAQRDPLGTFESNVRGTYHILEACRLCANQVKRVIIASSDKAYGDCDALPYVESTPLAARNPYDVSKSCADLMAQSYAITYHLPIAIARCGNIFGPGDVNWTRLVPGTMRSLMNGERPMIRSDGLMVRDYLFVDDAVTAYLALANWIDSPAYRHSHVAFNFSSDRPLTVLDMTRLIQDACGRNDLDPVVLNRTEGEIRAQHLDSTRAQNELSWSADVRIEPALRITAEWYRAYVNRHAFRSAANPLPMPQPMPARASA